MAYKMKIHATYPSLVTESEVKYKEVCVSLISEVSYDEDMKKEIEEVIKGIELSEGCQMCFRQNEVCNYCLMREVFKIFKRYGLQGEVIIKTVRIKEA